MEFRKARVYLKVTTNLMLIMSNDFDDYGSEYFEEVLTQIDEHPAWEYSADNRLSMEEVAEKASNFESEAEFNVRHVDTEGVLRLHAPNLSEPVSAAAGLLAQPLDGTQRDDPYEGSFGEDLMEAYQSIVDGLEAEYLTLDADPVTILGIGIPLDYEEEELNKSLNAASEASIEVQELNDDAIEVIESYQ